MPPFSVGYVKGWRRSLAALFVAAGIRALGIEFSELTSQYKESHYSSVMWKSFKYQRFFSQTSGVRGQCERYMLLRGTMCASKMQYLLREAFLCQSPSMLLRNTLNPQQYSFFLFRVLPGVKLNQLAGITFSSTSTRRSPHAFNFLRQHQVLERAGVTNEAKEALSPDQC